MSQQVSSAPQQAPALGIVVSELIRDFADKTAVDGVSFSVAPGRIVGLLGPNGAGKTTILKILACHLSPTSGSVSVGGRAWEVDSVEFKRQIGFLTREMNLYDKLTVEENLTFFGRLNSLPSRTIQLRLIELTERLGLASFLRQRYSGLSTGQKQRANIANTLLSDPSVLLLDEITASLDVLSCRHLLQTVREEAKKGKAVLYSTHIMSEAEYLCDEILFIHHGKLLAAGTPKRIIQKYRAKNITAAFFKAVERGAKR